MEVGKPLAERAIFLPTCQREGRKEAIQKWNGQERRNSKTERGSEFERE